MSKATQLSAALLLTAATLAALYGSGGPSRSGERAPARPTFAATLPMTAQEASEPESLSERAPAPNAAEVACEENELAAASVRAKVRLVGELRGAHGLGSELDLRLYPYWSRRPASNGPTLLASGDLTRSASIDDVHDLQRSLADQAYELDELGLTVVASPDGRFEHELGPMITASRELPSGFLLVARHENFRPLELVISLDRAAVLEERELTLYAFADLQAICWIRGSVSCLDASCPVRVEAWRIEAGQPTGQVDEGTASDVDGTFALSVEPGARYAIAAFADGFLPQTVVVYTWDQLDLWLAPIVLDHGVHISGALEIGKHTFGRSVWLYLSQENPVFRRDVHGRNGLLWNGAAFQPELQAARMTEDGTFDFAGLVPGEYELRFGIDREWWTEMDPVMRVRAPAEGLVIEPPLARVSIEIEQGRVPLARHPIRLTGVGRNADSVALTTDAWGRVEAWLFPGEPYVVNVAQPNGLEWSYGKVTPWERSFVTERIVMGSER